jgi:hypothetical protein
MVVSKSLQNKPRTSPPRDAEGRLLKGSTANPGGRPKTPEDIKEALAAANPRAIARLIELIDSKNEKVALKACELVIERNLGKVSQPVAHSGNVSYSVIDPFAEPTK